MADLPEQPVTLMLQAAGRGDEQAAARLLPLVYDELRRIAANPDWKEGMYRRYPVMQVLGVRGDLDLIPFLESLEPWKTDFEGYARVVEGHNRITWPAYVTEAIGSIRRRHWQTTGNSEGKQP